MKYRRLGNSGLKVSEISLGGWLTLGGSVDDALSIRIIHHAFHQGINLFDVADVYSNGRAEEVLGKAATQLPREQMVVATKVLGRMHEGPHGAGLSKKHIMQACEASLKRLKMDYIDLYQFHAPDREAPLEESLEAMDVLVSQGKVLYVGCSNFGVRDIRMGLDISSRLGYPRFVSNQPPYNMLDPDAEREIFPLCKAQGLGNVVYSPLAHGVLTGKYGKGKPPPKGSRLRAKVMEFESKYLTEKNLGKVEAVAAQADDLGSTPAKLALAWVLRRPEVSSAIVGATATEQLDENIGSVELELTSDVIQKLDEVLE